LILGTDHIHVDVSLVLPSGYSLGEGHIPIQRWMAHC
jgi:hypothetical protein